MRFTFRSDKASSSRPLDGVFSFIEGLPIGDRFILKALIIVSAVSMVWFGVSANSNAISHIPKDGGTLAEGIVGTPRFINPLLAVTTADKDMASLIYSGLMKLGPDGKLMPHMAESIHISDDGLVYNVVLKDNLTFHDGTPVTANDVIFTIARLQDPALKSPLAASFDGVSTEYINEHELNFTLTQPYSPFIENLTLGILPKHVWEFASAEEFPFSQFNSEPIGSGPYMIERINRTRSGIPGSYILTPFDGYVGEEPHIETLELAFFPNEQSLVDAFIKGDIESAAGLSPENIAAIQNAPGGDQYTVYTAPLPRTFAVFFNQNESPALRDSAVRAALDAATPRERIVSEVLGGYGEAISGPLPPGFGLENATTTPHDLEQARDILRTGGWRLNEESGVWEKGSGDETIPLSFSISTANLPTFQKTADILKEEWERLGAVVDVKRFEQSDLTQTIIRPRQYQALLFGTVVGRELDFFSFWHSSQRNDPGLNVALYANITTDSVLSLARTLTDTVERNESYQRFAMEIDLEDPAVFLYVPHFTYITPSYVENISLRGIAVPNERFSTVAEWYIETDSVWPIFTR